MIVAIRLRGSAKIRRDIKDTLYMLKLRRVNTMILLEKDPVTMGMIIKVKDYITWGEMSDEVKQLVGSKKIVRLKCAKGGLKSIKLKYPKGDLGYRGAAINDLIKRML
ncbi:uL30 family ribosomal protein [archaeon]|nr:uL30 family ribosomal protein [archaeon]